MRVSINLPVSLQSILDQHKATAAAAVTAGMLEAARGLEKDLERQAKSAGLGKLAMAWQSEVYPKEKDSLKAAAIIFPRGDKAGRTRKAYSAFELGAFVTASGAAFSYGANGAQYLAIPTANVPFKVSAQGGRARMSPVEVEAMFNADLVMKPIRGGGFLLLIPAVASKSKRGFRRASPRRLAQGRDIKLVPMFVLKHDVTIAKRLDIAGKAAEWHARLPSLIAKYAYLNVG